MNKLIFVSGAPGSGKDTFANAVEDHMDPLISVQEYLDRGLYGTDPMLVEIIPIKQTLINAVVALFNLDYYDWVDRYDTDLKEEPWDKLNGMSQREALIWLSEEVVKPKFGDDFFGKAYAVGLNYEAEDIVIAPDAGFVGELEAIMERVGRDKCVMINTFRDGKTFDKDSRDLITGDMLGIPGYTLNNNGTEEQFKENSIKLFLEITK